MGTSEPNDEPMTDQAKEADPAGDQIPVSQKPESPKETNLEPNPESPPPELN